MLSNTSSLELVALLTGICAVLPSAFAADDRGPGEACSVRLSDVTFTRSLNGAADAAVVDGEKLTLRSGPNKDYFNDPDGKLTNASAPVLLTRVNNLKPFTFVAKVKPELRTKYDAGALYLFSDDRLWQKLCYEKDEDGRSRVVSVRTIETSDDNNHDVLTADSVYLKISSDAETVGFYHSTDNRQWTLARLYKNAYPQTIWLGISSQSPVGDGMTAVFESCSLTEAAVKDFRSGQ